MKGNSFFKLIAKSMSIGLIPILVIAVIFTIIALIDPGWLILIPFVVVPLLIVIIPTLILGYAISKSRGRQRLTVPLATGLILLIGSFWIPPTSYMWRRFFDNKLLEEATLESCAKITEVHKKVCYERVGKKSGDPKICELADKKDLRVCYQGVYPLVTGADLCSSIDMIIYPRLKGLSVSAGDCIGRSKKDKAWEEACHRISQLHEQSRKTLSEKALCPTP